MTRRARAWITLTSLLATAVLAALCWLLMVYPNQTLNRPAREITIVIDPETRVESIAETLEREGFISNARVFAAYARLRLAVAHGELRQRSTPIHSRFRPVEILQHIATGVGEANTWVGFPEGFTRFDMARKLERYNICSAEGFLRAASDPALLRTHGIDAPHAEGYLFPSTYHFYLDSDPVEAVERMIRASVTRISALEREHGAARESLEQTLGWGRREIIVLASIVEKEAAVAEERPRIAGVFLNRLRSTEFLPRARLQADPTVTYGCLNEPTVSEACAQFNGRTITRAMLEDTRNPYNTYRISGLPPTPIANPGLDAIRAVLGAERHEFYYFVASGAGRHTFTRSLDEHHDAVRGAPSP